MSINRLIASLKADISNKPASSKVASVVDNSLNRIIKVIKHYNNDTHCFEELSVTMIPESRPVLFKRIKGVSGQVEKVPVTLNLAESKDNYRTFYHFLEPDTNKEVGFVAIADWNKAKDSIPYKMGMFDEGLIKNYPQLGVTGDRVSIDYVKNNNERLYAGVGNLADRLAIEYCLKHNLKPNVTLTASENAHSAHFQRGYRFVPVANFNGASFDPNKVVASRIKYNDVGKRVNTRNLGNLYMYMPQEVVKKHLAEIQKGSVLP